MQRNWLVGTLGTLACVAAFVAPANGYTPPELPWANCSGNIAADRTVIEVDELPEEGATVTVGTPVTFSAPSAAPVTFSVASLPTLLGSPDIDRGLAQPQPAPGGAIDHMQVFTSSQAASTPGTVYWQASFSAAEVPECAGLLSGLITVPPRILKVEPAPSPPSESPPPALSAAISKTQAGPRQVSFDVSCSTSCTGTATYVVSAARRHRRSRKSALGFGPWKVAIANAAGGVQQFTHRYAGATLRKLTHLAQEGDVLEIHITSTVTGADGSTTAAHKTTRLY